MHFRTMEISHTIFTLLLLFILYIGQHITSSRRIPDQNEYELDLNKLSADPDNLMAHIKHLASALETCGFNGDLQQMTLYHLRNRSVTCNDGSPAGYYLRKSYGSKKWLVFLEGGWYCFDGPSCRGRWASSRRLMSSSGWAKKKIGSGILSADPEENPVWWQANVVYIPYCSSDVWSGTSSASDTGSYAFMGALIIEEVLRELMGVGLLRAKEMVLAGSSAGGTAVLMNLDRISDFMASSGSQARVLGLADSGWFLETQQVMSQRTDCSDAFYCNPAQAIQIGTKLWNSHVPKSCLETYGNSDRWRCFFGFRIYESIKTPIFLFQWLYDEAQLTVGMARPPINLQHWSFMQKTGKDMRASLRNASVVFAPACYAHMILTSSDWTQIQVRNVRLYKAIRCWLRSHKVDDRTKEEDEDITEIPQSNGNQPTINSPLDPLHEMMDDEDEDSMFSYDGSQYLGIDGFSSDFDDDESQFDDYFTKSSNISSEIQNDQGETVWWWPSWNRMKRSIDATTSNSQNKNNRRKKSRRSRRRQKNNRRKTNSQEEEETENPRKNAKRKCQFRLLDHATCPHCNPTCPRLTNPFTGEDMEFLSFMRLFGLDLGAIAAQMGLDEQSLALLDPAAAMQLLAAAMREG